MRWLLIGYMFLFVHRPFEFYLALGELHVERVYMLGMILVWITRVPAYGSNPEGMWIFLLVCPKSFQQFLRGVHAWIWIAFVLLPHAVLVPLAVWLWGVSDGALFVAYSAAVASVYLAVQLRKKIE